MTMRQLTGILCGVILLAIGVGLLLAHTAPPATATITPTWAMHAQTEPVQYRRLYVVEYQQRQYLCEDLDCIARLMRQWWP